MALADSSNRNVTVALRDGNLAENFQLDPPETTWMIQEDRING